MVRLLLAALALGLALPAAAQFVYTTKPEYHVSEPGLYTEDPFIVEYRQEYFAVFRGDFARFRAAHERIKAMLEDNPDDARALVWYGNGLMVEAGLQLLAGKTEETEKLLGESSITLDRAVELSPDDPNIYMMRAASLSIIGQRFPAEMVDATVWERLRDDCLKFIAYVNPDRMPRASIHLRGEAYGNLGLAYAALGEKEKAKEAFEVVIQMNPGTAYEERAREEIGQLEG